MENNKGFTIIELASLLTIIGTLILLAVPKFDGLISKAKVINISNDLSVMETAVLTSMIMNDDLPIGEDQDPIDILELEEQLNNNNIFDKEGAIGFNDIDLDKNFYKLNKDFIESETTSRLKGDFILNSQGEVLYIKSNQELASNSIDLGNVLKDIKNTI